MEHKKLQVYVSGALSNLPTDHRDKKKKFYEDIKKVFGKFGHSAYVPHLHTDPIKNHGFTPEEVDEIDRREVKKADLMVVDAEFASTGSGIELEICRTKGGWALLLFPENKTPSRLLRGNEAVICEIRYTSESNALNKIWDLLKNYDGLGHINPAFQKINNGFICSKCNRLRTIFDKRHCSSCGHTGRFDCQCPTCKNKEDIQ